MGIAPLLIRRDATLFLRDVLEPDAEAVEHHPPEAESSGVRNLAGRGWGGLGAVRSTELRSGADGSEAGGSEAPPYRLPGAAGADGQDAGEGSPESPGSLVGGPFGSGFSIGGGGDDLDYGLCGFETRKLCRRRSILAWARRHRVRFTPLFGFAIPEVTEQF